MNWAALHFWFALATVVYALWNVRPKKGSQHVLGAELLLITWIFSWISRNLLNDISPVQAYSIIDAAAVLLFANIMFTNRAVWAALCVIFHALMLVMHLAYFVTGQVNQSVYLWSLGILFSASVLTVFIATAAGLHDWGERLDHAFMARFRGWTWSGVIRSRLSCHKRTVD